jgi:hypothetical protein
VLQEHFTGRGQLDVTARPLEQPRSQLALQLGYRLRQRRLRDVQALRGAAEVELLAQDGEVTELSELERGPIRVRGRMSQVTFAEGVQRDLLVVLTVVEGQYPDEAEVMASAERQTAYATFGRCRPTSLT